MAPRVEEMDVASKLNSQPEVIDSNTDCSCEQEGHFARECTEPRKERAGGAGGGCFNCGHEGYASHSIEWYT